MPDNEMPPQPTTVSMPMVTSRVLLDELTRVTVAGFARIEANIGLIANDLSLVKERVGLLESHRLANDERANKTSIAARGASQVDMEQAAQLVHERAAREAVEAKVDALLAIGARLERMTKNPLLKTLGAMLLTAAITWLASHGVSVR